MRKTSKKIAFIILVAVLLEVFLFNFRFWATMGYEPIEIEITNVGPGLKQQEDGSYIFNGEKDSYIEFLNIDEEIKNIYIDISCDMQDEGYRQFVTFYMTDEGNELYYKLPQKVIVPAVEKSKYIKLDTSGISDKLLISLDADKDTEDNRGGIDYRLNFKDMSVNKPVPFFFEPIRLLIVIFVLTVLYCLRFNTNCFDNMLCLSSTKQKAVLAFVILLNIIFAVFIYKNNLLYYTWDRDVYTNLAESLLQGRFDLPMLDVSYDLFSMDNPYDTNLRNQIVGGAGYYWDYAFYNGNYYVYFGIVPCLILFLPLKAVFNYDLPVNLAMLIFTIVYIIAGFRFIYTIVKRFFGQIPFILYLMLGELFVFGGALFPVFIRNDLYGIPNITALTFTIIGIDLWLNSVRNDEIASNVKLILGSLCMALAVGCRPQFALGSFFAVLIFGKVIWKKFNIDGFEKKDYLSIFLFVLPYILIGAFLMYYNYMRFGSVTDFGAMYNLTTNDMTKRGFRLGRLPYGIFAYLFQIPSVTGNFPFFEECKNISEYMGVTIVENMRGGIFIFNPLLFLNFAAYTKNVKGYLKERKLFNFVVAAQIFAFIILIADVNMAGLVNRYMIDFTWLLMLAAFAVFLCIMKNLKGENIKRCRFIFSVIFVFSMVCNVLLVFTKYNHYTMDATNPNVFYSIMYAVQFWL